jgi:hypothetical protein
MTSGAAMGAAVSTLFTPSSVVIDCAIDKQLPEVTLRGKLLFINAAAGVRRWRATAAPINKLSLMERVPC